MTISETNEKISQLDTVIRKASNSLKTAPEWHLRITLSRGRFAYYQVFSSREKHYISRSDSSLIKQLAQKDYDMKVMKVAKLQKKVLESFSKKYVPNSIERIFEGLIPERKRMIEPYVVTIKEKVEEWKKVEYKGLGFNESQVAYLTRNNEQVRSKSEVIIADTFDKFKVPYRYEYPLNLEDVGIIYPDFTVINPRTGKEFIFEHFGLIGNPDYEKSMNRKLVAYSNNGFVFGQNFLFTFETVNCSLNTMYLNQLVKYYLT